MPHVLNLPVELSFFLPVLVHCPSNILILPLYFQASLNSSLDFIAFSFKSF